MIAYPRNLPVGSDLVHRADRRAMWELLSLAMIANG